MRPSVSQDSLVASKREFTGRYGTEGSKGVQNNPTQEVPLRALVAGTDKGSVQESVAAMKVL